MNQYNKTIIHRLWRRDTLKTSTPEFVNSGNKQSSFMQNLSSVIKIFKKKQDFYLKVLFRNPSTQRPLTSKSQLNIINTELKIQYLQKQHQQLLSEEQQIIQALKKYQNQKFFNSKTYLYTVFVRLSEIIEGIRQKINNKVKISQGCINDEWQKVYDQAKLTLVDCYQNLIYFQKYNVIQLLNLAKKKQNHRIYLLISPKKRKTQIILNPIQKADSIKFLKTNSVELPSKRQKLQSILSKKLNKKDKYKEKDKKLQTQKKKQQKKQNPYKIMYGILNLKSIKIEDNFIFRRQMQLDAIQRNKIVNEQRKKWQKKIQQNRQNRQNKQSKKANKKF